MAMLFFGHNRTLFSGKRRAIEKGGYSIRAYITGESGIGEPIRGRKVATPDITFD